MAAPVPVVVRLDGREVTGTVRPGESWADTAARVAAAVSGDPVADDLSGEVKRFVVDPDQRIVLRVMTRGDLPIVARWLREAHVRRWWGNDGDPEDEQVVARYGPRVDGTTPIHMWVVDLNGHSIGFVQDYRIRDFPDFALLTPDPDAVGLDYVIGEPAWVGRGLGARVLWTWMLRARHRFPDASAYFAAPDHGNTASLRVLDKAGFVQGTWFDEPQRGGGVATVVGCSLDVRRVLGWSGDGRGP